MAKIEWRLPEVKLPLKFKHGILAAVLRLLYFTVMTPLALLRRPRVMKEQFGK